MSTSKTKRNRLSLHTEGIHVTSQGVRTPKHGEKFFWLERCTCPTKRTRVFHLDVGNVIVNKAPPYLMRFKLFTDTRPSHSMPSEFALPLARLCCSKLGVMQNDSLIRARKGGYESKILLSRNGC